MLRVGLTGGLGSGKSTVAAMLRELGAQVIEADALGRSIMEPGHEVYDQIVTHFGPQIVGADGHLNRARLADLAFRHGRLQELNAIVHPPVIEAQRRWMEEVFARDHAAIAVLESALIFEVVRDAIARGEKGSVLADWRRRIDRLIVVAAPDDFNRPLRRPHRIVWQRSGVQPRRHQIRCTQPPVASGSRRRKSRPGRLCP